MKTSPCQIEENFVKKDCPERCLGCHATCKRYKEYDEQNIKDRAENMQEQQFAALQVERYRNADKNRKAAWQRHHKKGEKTT